MLQRVERSGMEGHVFFAAVSITFNQVHFIDFPLSITIFRYTVHEKIVNFMAPRPMNIPPMAPKVFENLFGLKAQKPAVDS